MHYIIVWKKPFKDPVRWLCIGEKGEHLMLRNADHVTKFKDREDVNRALLALHSTNSLWCIDGAWPHIRETSR